MSKQYGWAIALVSAVFLAACTSTEQSAEKQTDAASPGDAGATAQDLAGTDWNLSEIRGASITEQFEGRESPSLRFESDSQTAGGFAGCNRFSGSYESAEGNGLRFSQVASTMMACADMEIESRYLQALDSVRTYERTESTLVLSDGESEVVLRFEATP